MRTTVLLASLLLFANTLYGAQAEIGLVTGTFTVKEKPPFKSSPACCKSMPKGV